MNFGTNSSETETGGWTDYSNLYDPDREYQQRLMAYEMYGPQGVTGWDFNYYNPYQTGYAVGPHWNYQNNPDGPDPNKLGLPPGGVGTGGAQPNEVPGGMNYGGGGPGQRPGTRVVPPRQVGPSSGGAGGGQVPIRGRGMAINPNVMSMSASQKVSTVPGGPGDGSSRDTGSNNNPNAGGPGGDGIGDPYADGDYYSNGPGGPGHGTWINGTGNGISGPMVRPADRNSNALYAGPFTKWGEGGASGNRQLAGGQVYDTLTDIRNHPDLPDEVKAAMTTGANEAANTQFDSAEARLNRYGRTTGNRGGNAAAVADLAKARGDVAADVNRKNALDFEEARYKRLGDATGGLANLYQSEGNFLSGMFGARGALANKPLGGKQQTGGHGNFVGTNLGFSIG